MKNIGACINCLNEFILLLANGLCPNCQDLYEKRLVKAKAHDEASAEIEMQIAESEKLAADYAGQGFGL